jgi:hypothetical protein
MNVTEPFTRSSNPSLFNACLAVRFAVFSDEQGFDRDVEVDAYDYSDDTLHFALQLRADHVEVGRFVCSCVFLCRGLYIQLQLLSVL